MDAITRITITHHLYAGNLGDLGLTVDDCYDLAEKADTAWHAHLAETHPGVPVEIESEVVRRAGVGNGITVRTWSGGFEGEDKGLESDLEDISNRITEDFVEAVGEE